MTVLQAGPTAPGTDFPMSASMAVLPPLPPAPHSVDIVLPLSADHWDGFGLGPAGNLVPAGEIHWLHVEFTVVK